MFIIFPFSFLRALITLFIILFVDNAFSNGGGVRPSLLDKVPLAPEGKNIQGEFFEKEIAKKIAKKIEKKEAARKEVAREIAKKAREAREKRETIKESLKIKNVAKVSKPIKKPVKKYKKPHVASNDFNFNKFPRRYNHWLLDVAGPNYFGGGRCVLRSNLTNIKYGYLKTPIFMEVFSDVIKISGQSPIDLSYSDLGIKVDSFERISIDAIFAETSAVFFVDSVSLIKQMIKGHKLDIALGFRPVSSLSQPYSTKISLKGFSDGFKKLAECERKLNRLNT